MSRALIDSWNQSLTEQTNAMRVHPEVLTRLAGRVATLEPRVLRVHHDRRLRQRFEGTTNWQAAAGQRETETQVSRWLSIGQTEADFLLQITFRGIHAGAYVDLQLSYAPTTGMSILQPSDVVASRGPLPTFAHEVAAVTGFVEAIETGALRCTTAARPNGIPAD
jgi:hypothetical protein